MKQKLFTNRVEWALILCAFIVLLWGCTKYKDPAPQSTPTLTDHYCNTPSAVNYNWGFPGIPDSSVCIFPSAVFVGNYTFYDSLQDGTGVFLPFDTLQLSIAKTTDSSIVINNFCNNTTSIKAKVFKNLRFTLDSTTTNGQLLCNPTDTINGYAMKKYFSDSSFTFYYNLFLPTGVQLHKGYFKKH